MSYIYKEFIKLGNYIGILHGGYKAYYEIERKN